MNPTIARSYEDLVHARKGAYYAEGVERALVRLVAERGGELWGGPGAIRGGMLHRSRKYLPLSATSNDPGLDEAGLRALLHIWSCVGGGHPTTAGAAAVASLRELEERGREIATAIGEDWHAIMRDSIHAGPVEWRAGVEGRELTYLDQRAAYLVAVEAGIPDRGWSVVRRPTPRDAVRLARDARVCVVLDATWETAAPVLPRRTSPWGGTRHELGRIRTTVRGPLVDLALRWGCEILDVHGLAVAPRVHLPAWTRAVRELAEDAGEKEAAKGLYQRLWGRLASCERQRGIVVPRSHVREGRVLYAWEEDDVGARHLVRWDPQDPPAAYRPDVAGEITSYAYARTLDLAARIEAEGGIAALLHVDAVLAVGDERGRAGVEWAVKAHGHGAVYGHGRYAIRQGERLVLGRMGLAEGERLEHADPMAPGELTHSSREWGAWSEHGVRQSWPLVEIVGREQHRSGSYPTEDGR